MASLDLSSRDAFDGDSDDDDDVDAAGAGSDVMKCG
jgi:hypothetical protein